MISAELFQEIRTTLMSCGPFGSDQALGVVFVHPHLNPWRSSVPQATSESARVDAIISFLIDKWNVNKENALVLFLRVLSERMDPGDICHQDLARVADRLEAALEGEEATETAPREPDVYAYYIAGVRRLIDRLGGEHPRYIDVLTYLQNLESNIDLVRAERDTERRRKERSELVGNLHRIAVSALGVGLDELIAIQDLPQDLLEDFTSISEEAHSLPRRISSPELLQVIEQAEQKEDVLLDLSSRGLTELPPEIGNLTKLERLDLNDNLLTSLPAEIAQLENLKRFDVRYNPLLPIPPEILERVGEPETILNYYLKSQEEDQASRQPLNEAKVLLVGQGGVGKTSLVKRMIDGTFDLHEEMTTGINVRRWQVSLNDDEPVCLNIWDFGGQEIMHATHQFFLTRRSLYLLVIDARQGEQESNLEYWLKLIQSFGEESPIIIVINKVDQRQLHLNRRGLMGKYSSIRAFVETSCKENEGIGDLVNAITFEVSNLSHIRVRWPKQWFALKRRLEETERDYIPYDTYQEWCADVGIQGERDQRTLLSYLHDLGIALNFQDDSRLEETNILNPDWVTRAVYDILNNNALFQANGVLKRSQLGNILDSERYSPHKYGFILGIMQKLNSVFPWRVRTEKVT